MPCPPIGVRVAIDRIGQRTVHLPAIVRRGRPVGGGAHQRMAESHADPELDQPGRLGRRGRLGTEPEPPGRAPEQGDVTERFGRRDQHQLPRIGMLYAWAEIDSLVQRSLSIFREAFERLGWLDGKNVTIEYRFTNDASRLPLLAEEMVALRPDGIIAHTTPSVVALQRLTATIPIVFISVGNPLSSGIVPNLPKPGGNVTGFADSVGTPPIGKLLELLRELIPNISRTALMFNPDTTPFYPAFLRELGAAPETLAVELSASPVHNEAEAEAAITAFAREPGGGLERNPLFGVVICACWLRGNMQVKRKHRQMFP